LRRDRNCPGVRPVLHKTLHEGCSVRNARERSGYRDWQIPVTRTLDADRNDVA
jgi:hypothetical protein